MHNTQKGFVVPLVIAIIAILVVGGVYVMWQKNKVNTASQAINPTIASTLADSNTITSNPDWKTYTNTKYGYSIKYPNNWFINNQYSNQGFTPRGPAPSIYMGGDTSISNYSDSYLQQYRIGRGELDQPSDYFMVGYGFTKIDPALSLVDYIKGLNIDHANKSENITINGIPAVKLTYLNITGIGGNTKPNGVGIYLKQSGGILNIGYGFDNSVASLIPIADQIISSLIFTQTTSADSDWKTYTNSQYGFSIQYSAQQFTLFPVTTTLPKNYKTSYSGQKLIFSNRVGMLGKSYVNADSGKAMVYSVEGEEGIEFIVVNDSIFNLTKSLDNSLKTALTVAGKSSIKWGIGAEGDGIDYYYIPLNINLTLIVKRTYQYGGSLDLKIFDEVIKTLTIAN